MQKDVLFIQGPYQRRAGIGNVFPLGIGYLIQAVQNEMFSWDFLDCSIDTDTTKEGLQKAQSMLTDTLTKNSYMVICICCITTGTIPALKTIVDTIRSNSPHSLLLIGGALPSIEETVPVFFKHYSIDGILRGDGEEILPVILDRVKANKDVLSLDIVTTSNRMGKLNVIHNINAIPIPYRDHRIMDIYSASRKRRLFSKRKSATIITSRGCPCSCFYCVSGNQRNKRFSKRSWDNIAEEISILTTEYDVDNIVFYDDCFFPNKKRVNQDIDEFLIELDKWGVNDFFWQNELRADVISAMSNESLKKIYSRGCRQINIGIETPDPEFLKYLGKTITKKNVIKAVDSIKSNCPNMIIGGTFIVGGPSASREKILETQEFASALGLHFANFFPLELHPGTPLYRDIYGNSDEWYETIIKQKNNHNCLLYENPDFPELELKLSVKEAYANFYDSQWSNRMKSILGDEYNEISGIINIRHGLTT